MNRAFVKACFLEIEKYPVPNTQCKLLKYFLEQEAEDCEFLNENTTASLQNKLVVRKKVVQNLSFL